MYMCCSYLTFLPTLFNCQIFKFLLVGWVWNSILCVFKNIVVVFNVNFFACSHVLLWECFFASFLCVFVLILVFLTPGLTFLKEEVEQIVYPQGKISHRKRRTVIAPFLIGTGIAAALGTGIGGISTSAHFYYKLSQELNEDIEQAAEIGESKRIHFPQKKKKKKNLLKSKTFGTQVDMS